MKYSVELQVNTHRDEVLRLITSHDHRKRWQPGFLGAEALDGEPGTIGATTRLMFQINGQSLDMIETILDRDLPNGFVVSYVSSQSASISRNTFQAQHDGTTLWRVDLEVKVNGPNKLLAFFSPNSFKQQTRALMQSFANYAEK